ncbi:flagellar basal body-associated FliL family protein [Marinobacterium marinum]|uniref:Flagellar protein FliL n=1 Tax=Marinobacterium marinum TaxID=2756129 RepID=A0A7W1WWS2_9GAMM|nr:flagellar basal body-associated FliL family protein [Marinobacterium marinum]MBA4501655.1 flagellar basal body-associated FliL family protein [Marinobacterium marinum]
MWRKIGSCLALLAALTGTSAQAEETAENYTDYIALKPFVTNYGGPGKVRFLKAEVTMQVETPAAHHAVNAHLAHIRNDLVFLFSAVEENQVDTVAAQKVLAEQALHAVQQLLQEETGQPQVSGLLFTSFVTQ